MATGNSGDPCRPCSSHEKISDVDAGQENKPYYILQEQDKVEEAEDLFQNYTYYQNQSEMEENSENGVMVPTVPATTDQLQTSPSSTMEIGRQLAIIGDELNHRKNRECQGMRAYFPLQSEHGYESFCRVAERLYDNGINLGQTIALLSFSYKMVTYVYQRGIMECFGKVSKSVAKFITKNQIAQWIVEQAGWTTALSIEDANLKWLFGILVAVMLGVAIAHKIYKP
ncbi:bcl-2 homologous antagonist/killer-like [Carcharodon carcharias]|uniref:bcl-2 homologous antagonist/killer-like n=1 Tax=Carcharodon carcharias TaxID=13397 RepID=UPI001B7E7F42|nr:bcl-2 homologous antagonist/killer-like [Carcharodon carcharias]